MREPEFDPWFVDWLRDGRSAPSDWVLPAVERHARRHPRRDALLVRWSQAMKAVALRHPLTSAAKAVVVVAAVAVTLGLGGLFLSRSPGLIRTPGPTTTQGSPTASPSASAAPSLGATPAPSVVDPATTLSGYLGAWRRGDQPWAEQHLASDHRTVLIGGTGLTDGRTLVNGAEHFEIIPGGRGWDYWESRGDPIRGGAIAGLPTVAGAWDPGNLVWAVFLLDDQGRIATQWLIIRPNVLEGHEMDGTYARPAPASVVTFLDECREAFSLRDDDVVNRRQEAIDCYSADAGVWISDNDRSGAWTETYTTGSTSDPDGPIGAWTRASGRYDEVERTGDVAMLGDIAAYPFRQSVALQRSSAATCEAGIDVLELTPNHDRIRSHWVFCGPDPLAPAMLPAEVTGTWGPRAKGPLSVALGTCDASGVCGTLRWNCHGEDCVGPLTYRGTTENGLVFEVTGANSFGCAYDQLGDTVMVKPVPNGLVVTTPRWAPGRFGDTLSRTEASPGPSPSPGG